MKQYAGTIQNVDQMAFEIEQPQLEDGEQADGTCADNGDISFDGGSHSLSGPQGGGNAIPHLSSCSDWKNRRPYM